MLKPPMPTITMKPSEGNPDGPPEIIIKAPEMTEEEKEQYEKQNKMI